jgi:molybdopterin/thiamine biosynthesis adenylyltransferase
MKPVLKMNYRNPIDRPKRMTAVPDDPVDRYQRINAIPWMRLKNFQECLPVVLGAGMNGSQVALNLATMGVKRMILIDPDRVSTTDLGKSPYPESDAKKERFKVKALKDMIHRMNSKIDIIPYPVYFSSFPKGTLMDFLKRGVQVVPVICVDNRKAMVQAVQFFNILGLSCYCGFLTAAELKTQVYVIRPNSGCFACAFNEDDFNMMKTKLSCTGKGNPEGGAPALYSTAGQCASRIIYEILRSSMPDLAQPIGHSYRITQSLLGGMELHPMVRSEECTFHYPVFHGVLESPASRPLKDLFRAAAKRLKVHEDEVEISFNFQDADFYFTAICPKCLATSCVGRLDLLLEKCPACGSRLTARKSKPVRTEFTPSTGWIPGFHKRTITLKEIDAELQTRTLRELPWITDDLLLCSTATRSKTLLIRG